MIYVASPYTDPDPSVCHGRALAVCEFVATLLKAGVHAFSPIAHDHLMTVHFGMPKEFEFYEAYDREFLNWCDEMIVHIQPGWDKSVGITAEIQVMREMNKKIRFVVDAESYLLAYGKPA